MDWQNIGAQLGISYAIEATTKLEDFEKLIIGQVKSRLEDVDPVQLKIAFDQNSSILKDVDSNELNNLKSYINSNDPRILQIKQNIANHMYHFNEIWALNMLQNELPDFYSVIMTDAKPAQFRKWFSDEIKSILNQVNELFSSNS